MDKPSDNLQAQIDELRAIVAVLVTVVLEATPHYQKEPLRHSVHGEGLIFTGKEAQQAFTQLTTRKRWALQNAPPAG